MINIKYKSTELVIPIIIALIAFSGGLLAGFITFEDNNYSHNRNDYKITNQDESYDSNSNNTDTINGSNDTIQGNIKNVFLVIDYKNNTVNKYNISTETNTVYDLLIETAENYNFTIKSTYYGQYSSYMVEQIGSKINGEDGRYWQYTINNEFSYLGANQQRIQEGDIISWNFEKPQF